MEIKIVTWNMNYWEKKGFHEESWNYFLNEIEADFYLFQESVPQNSLNNSNLVYKEFKDKNRNWGTGIYSKKHRLNEENINSHKDGSCVVASANIGAKKPFTLISLYGYFDKKGKNSLPPTHNLHRSISDLFNLFNEQYSKKYIVLGGDFNESLQFDKKYQKEGKRFHSNASRIVFERLHDLGLRDCYKIDNKHKNAEKDFIQTLRSKGSLVPWQNDYLFVNHLLEKHVKKIEVIDNEKVRKFSDHNPVIITLNIPK